MTDDERTNRTDPIRSPDTRTQRDVTSSRGAPSIAPGSKVIIGDPTRRGVGDPPDQAPKRPDPSTTDDDESDEESMGQDDDDAGEGRKGPRVGETDKSS